MSDENRCVNGVECSGSTTDEHGRYKIVHKQFARPVKLRAEDDIWLPARLKGKRVCGKCYASWKNYTTPRDPVWRMKYAPDLLMDDYQSRHPDKSSHEIYDHICNNIDRNLKRQGC